MLALDPQVLKTQGDLTDEGNLYLLMALEVNFLLMGTAVGCPKKPIRGRGEAAAGSGLSHTAGCVLL